MAYADFADVQARAGRFAPIFEVSGKRPDQADVEQLIVDCAAEIDAAITAAGFSPSSLDSAGKAALRDVNAYGALARGLIAADPGAEADDLLARALQVWDAGMLALKDGSFSSLAVLISTGGPGAGDFWTEEPSYGTPAQLEGEAAALAETNLAPAFSKNQRL